MEILLVVKTNKVKGGGKHIIVTDLHKKLTTHYVAN